MYPSIITLRNLNDMERARFRLTDIREQIAVYPGGHGLIVFPAFVPVNKGLLSFEA